MKSQMMGTGDLSSVKSHGRDNVECDLGSFLWSRLVCVLGQIQLRRFKQTAWNHYLRKREQTHWLCNLDQEFQHKISIPVVGCPVLFHREASIETWPGNEILKYWRLPVCRSNTQRCRGGAFPPTAFYDKNWPHSWSCDSSNWTLALVHRTRSRQSVLVETW